MNAALSRRGRPMAMGSENGCAGESVDGEVPRTVIEVIYAFADGDPNEQCLSVLRHAKGADEAPPFPAKWRIDDDG